MPANVCLFEFINTKVEAWSRPLKVIDAIPWSTPPKVFAWKWDPDEEEIYLEISAIEEILRSSIKSLSIMLIGERSDSVDWR